MSQSIFPTLITNTFIPGLWFFSTDFTREYADLHYVKFPIAQGSQSFPLNLNVDGKTTLGATNLQTINSTENATHYLNFSNASTTGVGAIQKSANFSVNPSTGTLTASGLVTATDGIATTTISLNYSTIPTFTSAQIGFIGSATISSSQITSTEVELARTVALPVGVWIFSFSYGYPGNFTGSVGLNNFIKSGSTTTYASATLLSNATFASSAIVNVSYANNAGSYPSQITTANTYVFLGGQTAVPGQVVGSVSAPGGFFRYVRIA